MKPVNLSIKGLRSYRETVEIDFPAEGGLLAIVGDTGSGKSSILEAIVYALFSSPSWAGDDVRELIADDEPEMRVAFTFDLDGVRWRVSRAHKQNTARSVHKLENLTHPGDAIVDAREVTARIEQILGFDRDTFLSSVILPQGRFNRLLTASEKQRTDILSATLRLGELENVWRLCDRTIDQLTPLVDAALVARTRLGDPQADVAAARSRLAPARQRLHKLRAVADGHQKIQTGAEAARRRVEDREARAVTIRASLDGCAERMAALAIVEANLSAERSRQEQARDESALAAQAAARELAEADRAGTGLAVLARADATLEFLVAEVPRLAQLATELDRRGREQLIARDRLVADDRALQVLAASVADAQARKEASDAAVTAIVGRRGACRDAFRSAVSTRKEVQVAEANVASAQSRIPALEDAVRRAAGGVDKAVAGDLAATAALQAAERADHAAACAHGLSAGAPCPVCGIALPESFAPPAATSDLAGLRDAAESAATARRLAEQSRTSAEATLQAARDVVQRAVAEADRRRQEESAAIGALHAMYPGADLEVAEEAALAGLVEEVSDARKAAVAAASDHEAARDAHVRDAANLTAARRSVDQASGQLATDQAEHDRCSKIVEQRRRSLPEAYRPAADADGEAMTALRERLAEWQSALSVVENSRTKHDRLRQEAADACDALAARRITELDRPVTAQWGAASALHSAAAAASSLVGTSPPSPLDPTASIAEKAAQIAGVEQSAREILAALDNQVSTARSEIDGAAREVSAILTKAGIVSATALAASLDQALKDVGADERAEAEAVARIEPAQMLAEVVGPFHQRVGALRDIKDTMTNATFVAEVRRRREAHLLRAASQILLSLSGGRYEFAGQPQDHARQHKQFVIYDHVTGQERPPQTLSGGETFLASLALALGLVEIAGRHGDRLEALFLDEGFGSLDDSALDEAVSALEKAATDGRLVTVVTHLRRVMDSIDQVLAVVRRPTGSQVHRLGATERSRAAEEEATAGLLV